MHFLHYDFHDKVADKSTKKDSIMLFRISAACVAAATFSAIHAFNSSTLAWPAGTQSLPTTELKKGKVWSAGEACDMWFHGIDYNSYYGEDKKLDRGSVDGMNTMKKKLFDAGICDCNYIMNDNCDKFDETVYKARFLGIFPDHDNW